ncbi:MAG TPA: glycosyltransferase family 2 protein [Candidatus Eisenbacteria bacterium]|jgi:glycosyltransferase involved in cell wall biosynthesis
MNDRLPLSVLLLAHNEAPRLAALLPTLSFARELVVVDSGSTDGTPEVAARNGARVLTRALDGFGRQRQFALDHCREDWVLWLDADERLDAVAERAVRGAVGEAMRPDTPAGYRMERRTWFLGRRIRHCGWGGERILRLFRRSAVRFDEAPVHERAIVNGGIAELPGAIEHLSYETWGECRQKLVRYAAAGAERARRGGRRARWVDLVLRPPARFVRMYVLQAGFLDGSRGLLVCALAATQVLLKYGELWAEPHRAEGNDDSEAGPETAP